MFQTRAFASVCLTVFLAIVAFAQQPGQIPPVKTVEVTASVTEAEVGQQVTLSVVAKDETGKVVNLQPSAYFAGPFDIAAADDNGTVRLFGPGEVTAGALVGGKPGFVTIMVKRAGIKSV